MSGGLRLSLTKCLQGILAWTDSEKVDFQYLLTTGPYDRCNGLRLCYECGLERGIVEGQHDMAVMLLEARFGPLSPEVRRRLSWLSPDQVLQVARDLLNVQSLKDLRLED
jgi:hypothetical protein